MRDRRRKPLAHWRLRAEALEVERKRMSASLPERLMPTIGKIHLPLLYEMLAASGHEDVDLIDDMVAGFPVRGAMHTGGIGRRVEGGRGARGRPMKGVVPDVMELRAQCSRINRETLAKAEPDKELGDTIWEKTLDECRRGVIGPLQRVRDVDLSDVLLVHRCGIAQWKDGVKKVRMIDDYRSNAANQFAIAWETTHNDREDTVSEAILRLQRRLAEQGSCARVRVALEDFVGAYKTLAPSDDQRWLMWVLVWNHERAEWMCGEMQTMPFGAVGGVLAWWRCAMAQRAIMRRLFETVIFLLCG